MTNTVDTLYRLTRAASWGEHKKEAAAELAAVTLPHRLPIRLAHLAISRREEFTAANMTGGTFTYWQRGQGILPYDWRGTFQRDTADGLAYIVYSYATPIAWERSDGLRVIPSVSYSVSTARHQYAVRRAWGLRQGQQYAHPSRSMATL